MTDPRRIYRLLLNLYPARFREEYAGPLERQFRDDYREAQGFRAKTWFWMTALADLAISIPAEMAGELRQDLQYAARIYRQRWTTTALALVALALAIGATTGVFSVVNALLLRSLPFRQPERLVELWQPPVNSFRGRAQFQSWVKHSPYLDAAAAYQLADMTLDRGDGAVRIKVAETTADLFAVLGVEPEIGRPFAAGEDLAGRDSVTILSHALWQQAFGGDPRVLGSVVRINGTPMTVVGIAPAGLDYPNHTALWTPTVYDMDRLPKLGVIFSRHIGRIKPGVTMAQATIIFDSEARAADPTSSRAPGRNRPALNPLRDQLIGTARNASMVLLGAVGFVLLIACANVAHLLLSRVTERQQELVIRAAMGASRARLVQQMISECTLLTVVAAAAGMLVANWSARLANSVQPSPLAVQSYTIMDWRVLGFAVALAMLTGLIFGVLPATLIGRIQPSGDIARMRSDGRTTGTRRLRAALVAMQAAFTMILLAASVMLGRTFLKLAGADLGFQTAHAVTLSVAFSGTPHENTRGQYAMEALDRLRAIPGVEAAGAAEYLPLTPDAAFMGGGFQLTEGTKPVPTIMNTVTPGYFAAMRTPLIEGREFTAQDYNSAILSDEAARLLGATGNLLGRQLQSSFDKQRLTIVGVVRAASNQPGQARMPMIFVPVRMRQPATLTFVARVRGNAEAYVPVCRDALRSVDAKVPVFGAPTLDERLTDSLAKPRFYTTAVLFFGVFALLLAVTGVYSVANFSIVQRTHEIGVRLAVGASPERLRATLLGENLLPVSGGAVLGIGGAMAVGQVAEHLIDGAKTIGALPCALR